MNYSDYVSKATGSHVYLNSSAVIQVATVIQAQSCSFSLIWQYLKLTVAYRVRLWGKALVAGRTNERQSPEEALADLEILEACLKSGDQDGKPIKLECQTW